MKTLALPLIPTFLRRIAIVAIALVFVALAARAQVVVLNFDDIPTGGGVVQMPSGYGGLTWDQNIGVWGWTQDPYNPSSFPNRVLFNYDGSSGVAESKASFIGGPQIFDGAYFSGIGTVDINLYLGGSLVATSSVLTLSSTATFLPSDYSGLVDSVGIVGNEGLFAMDDFTYQVVPEPAAVGMLAIGILAAALRSSTRSR